MMFRVPLLIGLSALCAVAQTPTDLSLLASDGQALEASYYGPPGAPKGGVLLLHMYGSNRLAWQPLAPRLAASGYHVVSLDLRGHGKSAHDAEGNRIDISDKVVLDASSNPFLVMHRDAKAGLDALVAKGAPKDRLAIVGAGVGASVALQAAAENGPLVSAIALMSPELAPMGIQSLEHADRYGARPALILTTEDEVDRGPRDLKERLPGTDVELRIVPGSTVHGTRMFGRVDTIEADIIQWMEGALTRALSLAIPVTKDLFIDGAVESVEGEGATRLDMPLEDGRNALVRVSRNRRHLVVGFQIPERYIRRNTIVVFVQGDGALAPAPTTASHRVSYNPKDPTRDPILAWRGTETGEWKEGATTGIQAYAKTHARDLWSAEVAIPLATFLPKDQGAGRIRIAFQIDGQNPDLERYFPPNPNLKNLPAAWVVAEVAPL
jgi:pimeloyl-ACP methyl ester carboxylesterase